MKNILSLAIAVLFPIILFSQDYEEIKAKELPKGVHEYLTKNMPGATIARAARGIEQGQTIYAAVIEVGTDKRVMIFDKDGAFLRKANSLSSTSTDPPPMSNTANSKSERNSVPQQSIPEKSLPASTQKFLKDNHSNYTLLEITYIPFSNAPLYKVILRDSKSDNVYIFNADGGIKNKRSYELSSSPFTKQFPLAK